MNKSKRLTAVLAAILAIVIGVGNAHAFTIKGKVVNGTTGDENIDTKVIVVSPSGGMAQEIEVQATAGQFVVENLDGNVSMYLLRVDYNGVSYNATVQPGNRDEVLATVSIYETTESQADLHIRIPHLAARRHGDHLSIERVYEVTNHTNPPRTVTGESGSFLLTIPDNATVEAIHVASMGVPIERSAVPTDTPGLFRIEYPLRPGLTNVGVTYTVPYENSQFTLSEKLPYDVHEIQMFMVDPAMAFRTDGMTMTETATTQGVRTYGATGLGKGSEIAITFVGGSGQDASASSDGGGQPVVSIVPNPMENASLMVMVIVLLALLAFLGLASHGADNPLDSPDQLTRHYSILLKRLAKLDDLHQAETIPADAYRVKRTELKHQLAALKYRLHAMSARPSKRKSGHGSKQSPGVATQNRSNAQ